MSAAPKPSSSSRSRRDKDDTNNPDVNLPGIGNYVFQKTVGEGNFAKVKLATHKLTKAEVAIKVIDKTQLDEKKLGKLYREVRIMKMLHHPNIIKLYEVIETKSTVFLVMEYSSGGELYDYLVVHGKMKEKEARAKFRQILSAVSYCHKKRVIHRDLKAENLLLDSNLDIKIADFGFSNYYDPESKLDTFCGSPPYAAPELFQGRRYTGPEVDIWSLGVILYVLTTGCLPFDGKNLQEMRESVCRGKYRIPFYLSDGCEKLLRKFLVRDPAKRSSLDMLIDDPWINESYGDSPISTDASEKFEEDETIIKLIEIKFKVDRETILNAIRENVYNDIAALYYVLYYEKKTREVLVGEVGGASALAAAIPDIVQMNSPTRKELSPVSAKPNMIAIEEDAVLPPQPASNSQEHGTSHGATAKANGTTTTSSSRRRRATVGGDDSKFGDESDTSNEVLKKKDSVPSTSHGIKETREPESIETRPVTAAAAPHPHVPTRGVTEVSENTASSASAAQPSASSSSASVANQRKRHNTIVGIFRNGRRQTDSAGPTSPTTATPGETIIPEANSQELNEADSSEPNKPRSLRFTFNSNSTSSKPPDEIIQEVMRTCNKLGVSHKLISRYLLEGTIAASGITAMLTKEVVKFEVEVCKLPRLNNLHGLRFKRLGGPSGDYRDICEKILANVAL